MTPKQYEKLNPEEKKNYFVSKWSRYKKAVRKSECCECGHVQKYKVRIPAKNAKPLKYMKYNEAQATLSQILNPGLWREEVQRQFNTTLIE